MLCDSSKMGVYGYPEDILFFASMERTASKKQHQLKDK